MVQNSLYAMFISCLIPEVVGQSLIFNIFGDDSNQCVYHYIHTTPHLINIFSPSTSWSKQQIVMSEQDSMKNLNVANLLKLEAKCVVSVFREDSSAAESSGLQALIRNLRSLDKYVVVYLSTRPPLMEVQAMLSRPLLWINSTNKNSFEVYCPKEGKPKIPSVEKFILSSHDTLASKGKMTKLPISMIKDICGNPMKGQVLTLADVAGYPQVILPNLLNNKHLSGYSINMFLLYAKYFRFQPKFAFTGGGSYMVHNDSFSPGKFHHVMTGKADLCTGAIDNILRRRYDLGVYMWLTFQRYITRQPRPVNSYGNISKPFTNGIWAVSIMSILSLAILIYVSHTVYWSKDINQYQIAKEEKLVCNFFLFAFAKLTEPDPLPWFNKWSTGRFAVFLWSLLSLFLLMFYTSNLRAYMVMLEYEKAPTDLYDIYNRGQRVYIYDVAPKQRKEYLEMTGQQGTIRYKVADLAERTGGIFSPLEHQGLHKNSPKDMIDNGAFVLTEDLAIPYLFLRNKLWRRENIYILPEVTTHYYTNHVLRKHSPATAVINKIARRAVEMGLMKFWITEHLSTRALTAPKLPQVNLGSLKLSALYTSLMFFGCGMLAALIVFIFEIRKATKTIQGHGFALKKSKSFLIKDQTWFG